MSWARIALALSTSVRRRFLLRFLQQLERVADHALDALARVDHLGDGDLVRRALAVDAAEAGVGVLGVLAHDDHVDVGRLLVLQRAERLVVEADRAQVHEQVEASGARPR